MSISDRMSELDRMRERMMRAHRRRIEEVHQRLYKPLTPEETKPKEKMKNIPLTDFDPEYTRKLNKNGYDEVIPPSFDVANPPENTLLPGQIVNGQLSFHMNKQGYTFYRALILNDKQYKSFSFKKQSITNCGITLIHNYHLPMFMPQYVQFFDGLVKKAQGSYPHIMTTHNHHYAKWFENWEQVFEFKNPNSGNRVSIYVK